MLVARSLSRIAADIEACSYQQLLFVYEFNNLMDLVNLEIIYLFYYENRTSCTHRGKKKKKKKKKKRTNKQTQT